MANKKVRIRPPANDYADVLHPETTASVVIEETNKRFMTDAERTKLSGVEAGANKYTHPAGTNPHGTTKADVGLANAENKSSVTIRGEITSANVTSALGFTPLNNAIKGKPSGVAELDSGGKVPSAQLPSYVDDVLEFNTLANFPTVGEAGKIYVAIGTNLAYRWSGSAYTVISPSLALGETTATAYRGDRGKTAYDHSQLAHAPANAQKNSAITKAEIEAKLAGEVTTHSHQMSGVTGLATVLSGKVDNSQVLTNVPSGAKFTDTVTTINGKTGAIAKADIVALGIPASDTNTTYTEITTAEIDAGTASTRKTISGRRVKYILDKVQGWIDGLTKSDVGLSNVDNLSAASIRSGTTKSNVGLSNVTNDKQMPISGGVLENYREKLTTVSAANGSIDLSLGNVFQHTPSGNRTYSITNAVNGQAHSFTLIVNMGSAVRTLTFPAGVKWQGGEIPDLTTASKTYVLTFMSVDGGTNWLGMFGGEF